MKKKISELEIHPFNERVYGPHDVGITSLSESLDDHGQQVPIKVTPDGLIISGGRRWTAATKLEWDTVDVEVVTFDTEEEMKKYTLLANRYRGKKPPAMQAREADAWREMLEKGEVTKDDLVEYARDMREMAPSRRPSSSSSETVRNDMKANRLAPRAAGISPRLYERATYVLDPQKGEDEIQQSDLPAPTRSTLVRQIREDRAKLEADEISPTAAERRARSRLKEKVQEHTLDEEEIRQQEREKAEQEMRKLVRRFRRGFTSLISEYGNEVNPTLAESFANLVRVIVRDIRNLNLSQEETEDENVYVLE